MTTIDHSAIRILFRAPDSLSLYGIPYEMRKDVGQEPRHLWNAAKRRVEQFTRSPDAPVGKDPMADWRWLDERSNENRAWLSALADVPDNPCEWCPVTLASDAELSSQTRHDELATVTHEAGDIVRVLPAYHGSGRYAPDGAEGIYLVKSPLLDKCDYRLIQYGNESLLRQLTHAQRVECANVMAWDRIVNPSRFVRHFWQTAR